MGRFLLIIGALFFIMAADKAGQVTLRIRSFSILRMDAS